MRSAWNTRIMRAVGFVLLSVLALGPARGQCTPTWLESPGLPGLDADCTVLLAADLGGGPRLFAGGTFTVAGGAPVSRVAQFDGTRRSALGPGDRAGLSGEVLALAVSGGAADRRGRVYEQRGRVPGAAGGPVGRDGVGGDAGGVQRGCAVAGGGRGFAVRGEAFTASGAASMAHVARTLAYQWRRGGVAIADGPAPGGSVYAGVGAATLRIQGLLDGDTGSYDCLVSNAFGSMASDEAAVAVCPAGYNCDAFVDFLDCGDSVTAFETWATRTSMWTALWSSSITWTS